MDKDFQISSLIIVMTITFTLMVPFIILLGFMFRNRHIRHLKEKQQLQQEILRTQIEIQQQTLHTVSQEIHDNIGQLLSMAKMQLNIMEESSMPEQYKPQIIKTNETVGKAIEDLRNLAKGVNPDFVQTYGLAECTRFELDRLQNTGVFTTNMQTHGTPYSLDLSKEFVIYRVIQENLNNIIRHSKATAVSIDLYYAPNNFKCRIADNGQGFDMEKVSGSGITESGSGLKNMQQRIKMIDGVINIDSQINKGTTVEITLPIS